MAQLSLEQSAPMSVDTRDEYLMGGSLQVPDSQYGTELMRDGSPCLMNARPV
ncbi:hypothetical protein E4U60_002751 [Claviceps pazoutovae]|uniref:Uncharacterized protein n=1 Tax=Claviceps pazoutovae TaxID=1649127 RepID=A0A9P7MAZ4_9HYPO|nr:hypothetical protein E4U60_002751 [Claviceps pazoutovae]